MAHKNYILDTSTIAHDGDCFKVFEDNNVIIPMAVLEELDGLKVKPGNVGTMSRMAVRNLWNYFSSADPKKGIDIGKNTILFIDPVRHFDDRFNCGNKDDIILACAASYENAILVSKDIALRLRALSFGIEAQDYTNDKLICLSDLYTGQRDIELTDNIDSFTDKGLASVIGTVFEELHPNEFVNVMSNGKTGIYRRLSDNSLARVDSKPVFNLKSKNKEQTFALDLILDKNVPLVTLAGRSGTGKTLITIAACLELIMSNVYSKLEIYRPIQSVGAELGFTPGTVLEKLQPWMGAIYDSMEFLLGPKYEAQLGQYSDRIKLEAISYIRGKSANNTLLILDECQNITKNEIKTIITRVGHNSKIIILGDIEQIDQPFLDPTNNGLTYVIESFKDSKLAGHVLLTKGERSELATEASRIL